MILEKTEIYPTIRAFIGEYFQGYAFGDIHEDCDEE